MEATTDSSNGTKKQGTLPAPGMQRKTIKAVEEAAQGFLKVRDKRMDLTKKEKEAKSILLEAMRKNADKLPRNEDGEAIYVFEDEDGEERFAIFTAKENVRVRKAPTAADDEEE